jgi:uncharacterized protein
MTDAVITGVLAGPICGLRYQTPSASGVTDEHGAFPYLAGETVTFLIGGLVLGTTKAAPRVNLAQLVNRAAGNIEKLRDPGVTNLARLVLSLDHAGGFEGGMTIAPAVHEAIAWMPINFSQPEDAFEKDPMIVGLLAKLDAMPGAFTANTPLRGMNCAATSGVSSSTQMSASPCAMVRMCSPMSSAPPKLARIQSS